MDEAMDKQRRKTVMIVVMATTSATGNSSAAMLDIIRAETKRLDEKN
jgi:hypothetical protein